MGGSSPAAIPSWICGRGLSQQMLNDYGAISMGKPVWHCLCNHLENRLWQNYTSGLLIHFAICSFLLLLCLSSLLLCTGIFMGEVWFNDWVPEFLYCCAFNYSCVSRGTEELCSAPHLGWWLCWVCGVHTAPCWYHRQAVAGSTGTLLQRPRHKEARGRKKCQQASLPFWGSCQKLQETEILSFCIQLLEGKENIWMNLFFHYLND